MIKRFAVLLAMIVAAALPSTSKAEPLDALASRLQNVSVTLHMERGQCSGTIITRAGENYVLTAGHCVEHTREVQTVLNDNGTTKVLVKFPVVEVVREIYRDGRSIGTTTIEADVVAFSSADYGHDLALLKLRASIISDSTEFSTEDIAPVGTELVHIGSLLGQAGSNSFTTGSISQIGRVLLDRVFDQTSCTAFPGSSGGGVFLKSNGQYVGTLVRAAGAEFNLIVPLRRIRDWAKAQHVEFIFDPKATPELDKVRLEDNEPLPDGVRVELGSEKFNSNYKFLK